MSALASTAKAAAGRRRSCPCQGDLDNNSLTSSRFSLTWPALLQLDNRLRPTPRPRRAPRRARERTWRIWPAATGAPSAPLSATAAAATRVRRTRLIQEKMICQQSHSLSCGCAVAESQIVSGSQFVGVSGVFCTLPVNLAQLAGANAD